VFGERNNDWAIAKVERTSSSVWIPAEFCAAYSKH
jgi:hypothetical protein